MKIQILAFGIARDLLGYRQLTLDISADKKLSALIEELTERSSSREIFNSFSWAVNQNYIQDIKSITLKDGDEVAILPPVSGG